MILRGESYRFDLQDMTMCICHIRTSIGIAIAPNLNLEHHLAPNLAELHSQLLREPEDERINIRIHHHFPLVNQVIKLTQRV
jgi:hypothetical protein